MAGRFQGVLQDEDSLAARMAVWKKIYCPPHRIHGVNAAAERPLPQSEIKYKAFRRGA